MQSGRWLISIWTNIFGRGNFEDLNRHLPEDIAVTKIKEVDDRFHSRYQAVEKTYRYRIRTSPVPNVFERKFLYQYGQTLDVDKMKKRHRHLWERMILLLFAETVI